MKFVLIAVALLDDLRCGSKVGGAPRSGIGASGVGAVKETEICNLREFAMSLLGTVVSGRRFSFSGQKALRRSLGKEFAKSMSHFTPNPMRSIPSRHVRD
jgi:hypothetical protein